MLMRLLVILASCSALDEIRYSVYYSDDRQTPAAPFDCLYAVWDGHPHRLQQSYVDNNYLIPYCRRPDDDDQADSTVPNTVYQVSFRSLKQQGVSSAQLLTWISSIDDLERYEMSNDSSDEVFYNCSSPWFGSRCQYRFPLNVSLTFSDIVRATFASRRNVSPNVTDATGACYRFIDGCDLGPWPFCIDWREICDGVPQCPNGEDEQWCEQLEKNECSEDEYRCHNGQCIPAQFAREDSYSVDCLDGSDERNSRTVVFRNSFHTANPDCISSEPFYCEERMARYFDQFVCGDGQESIPQIFPASNVYCGNGRDRERNRRLYSSFDHIENGTCRDAFFCVLYANRTVVPRPADASGMYELPIFGLQFYPDCEPLQKHCRSEWLFFPAQPILFGFFQFVYFTNRSLEEFQTNIQPDLVCFEPQKCPGLFNLADHVELNNGLFCCPASLFTYENSVDNFDYLTRRFRSISTMCFLPDNETSCSEPSTFHCEESRQCIPLRRVRDGRFDCHYDEDERFDARSFNDSNRFVCLTNPNVCLSSVAVGNGVAECHDRTDEQIYSAVDLEGIIPYSKVCSDWTAQGFILSGIPTQRYCYSWPCDSAYVHCDGIWDCPNGADELNCSYSTCSPNEHECYNEEMEQLYCLPVSQMFDELIDECRSFSTRRLYFNNETSVEMSGYHRWNDSRCLYASDICRSPVHTSMNEDSVCLQASAIPSLLQGHSVFSARTHAQLCRLRLPQLTSRKELFLASLNFANHPPVSSPSVQSTPSKDAQRTVLPNISVSESWFCYRGILVLHGPTQSKKCFCPPSYFGAQCQWQSQRVSLTLRFAAPRAAFTATIFQAVVMLVDEAGEITPSHEHLFYVPARDCAARFNLYLLYPNRPKSPTSNYSIRIDFFEQRTLDFWTSWHLPIPLPFLPVSRITAQLIIPEKQQVEACPLRCGDHGRCVRYNNDKARYFCRCHSGFSGPSCNQTHSCRCATDAFCLSANICVCPLYRFGRYCHLKRSTCQSKNDSCEHDGLCIPADDRIDLFSQTCLCKEGYAGRRCEHFNSRVNVHFDASTAASSSFVFIHIVTAFEELPDERTTLLKRMPVDRNRITFAISNAFNLVFVQLTNQSYYLAISRENFVPSENIDSQITVSDRCPHFNELANATNLTLDRKDFVDFYPLICRQNIGLRCFYDDRRMCVCDTHRFANCFAFNHTIDDDCQGHNHCENNGRCFQNNQTCPTNSICVCRDCFYGGRCQVSAEGYLFSLDAIIGYYIRPSVPFPRQPAVVKLSMVIVLIIALVGFTDGIASTMTFRRQKVREVGSGDYLLVSTILSMCMLFVLTIKFFHLLFSQMHVITNRTLLSLSCMSIDLLLKCFLASNQWLVACVAIERMTTIIRGTQFNKTQSKLMAKRVIPAVLLLVLVSHVHDPIYRQVIEDNDDDEHRFWCFVRYPQPVNIYNSAITLLHLIGPLAINFFSGLFIVVSVTRTRSVFQPKQAPKVLVREQLYRHKHLLYAPCALVILGSPRLVISFLSGCMKSPREPWLFLFGYFAAFIPPALTCATFVLPSSNYRRELLEATQSMMKRLRTLR